ncbi:nuclear transport factor 2 family protein [Rhodocytophaga aerolata]|uniref:Nuclear transport factor 2 family protein n=1 Tax=Rhodocytophaga aerolata TaxID=455078 RepID=A0ABT8RIG1_9BACT|nr:nuclear transport factor 2 family protein [Rhodocytophaga aerolata]MDO1451896.1 nuclear transport factor 2 family protein [Rhodocytophaga aerolata]
MKQSFLILSFYLFASQVNAQDENVEATIRGLEKAEARAVVENDTLTLYKLWDKEYVVNSPDNAVTRAGKSVADRPVLKRTRSSLIRQVESILIQGNVVLSMGNETVTPTGDQTKAGQTLRRRYTNVWMKKEGNWKLIARHANIICE